MGVTFYCHLYRLFDEILAEEPEVCSRLKELLDEITIDEVAHVGQRRNFVGPIGMGISKALVKPFYTMFFKDIPEIGQLLDVDQMIKDGVSFDFNELPAHMIERSWVPPILQGLRHFKRSSEVRGFSYSLLIAKLQKHLSSPRTARNLSSRALI